MWKVGIYLYVYNFDSCVWDKINLFLSCLGIVDIVIIIVYLSFFLKYLFRVILKNIGNVKIDC